MGLFNTSGPVDEGLLQFLHPDNKRSRAALAKTQAAIREGLEPDEQVVCIAHERMNHLIPVVTSRRLLLFADGRLNRAVSPKGLSVQFAIDRVLNRFSIIAQGPELVTGVDMGARYTNDTEKWSFESKSDADALYESINSLLATESP